MSTIKEKSRAVRSFAGDVAGEMRKTTWPGRQELVESTMVVIISLILLSLFVGICDKVLVTFLRVIIPAG